MPRPDGTINFAEAERDALKEKVLKLENERSRLFATLRKIKKIVLMFKSLPSKDVPTGADTLAATIDEILLNE